MRFGRRSWRTAAAALLWRSLGTNGFAPNRLLFPRPAVVRVAERNSGGDRAIGVVAGRTAGAFVGGSGASPPMRRSLSLGMSNNQFDVSKPTFDLLSLRNVRGDALLRYNTLNQSEPLRINLYFLLAVSLLAFPSVSEAVVGEPATLPAAAASVLGGLGSLARFFRECGRRSNQLSRIEKELNSQTLAVRLPDNRFSDRLYSKDSVTLGDLRGSGRRVVAIRGTKERLREELIPFRVARRRLLQASTVVVAVPTDGSTVEDWGIGREELVSAPYLAETRDVERWIEYFRSLVGDGDGRAAAGGGAAEEESLAWFGLQSSGRSFGSGVDEAPRLIEILGQSLPPVDLLDETDPPAELSAAASAGGDATGKAVLNDILAAQSHFYDALTSGDLSAMKTLFVEDTTREVEEVIAAGGRIDQWEACLEDGARPSGMKISGADALIVSDAEAYSTCIEFPPDAGIESATLLAIQRWRKGDDNSDGDRKWKLDLHQTIPWSMDSRAGGTLRCDCRGCVALTRALPQRWNFRGMID